MRLLVNNILVTGGNGFIGSHLIDALCIDSKSNVFAVGRNPLEKSFFNNPDEFRYYEADLNDELNISKIISDNHISTVYHIAWSNFNATAQSNIVNDVKTNVISSIKLFDACVKNDVQRIIYLSSGGTVYGMPEILPVEENHPKLPVTGYGVSKLTIEHYLQMYSRFYGVESVILRPSVPYGPRQNPIRGQGAITTFLYKALHNQPISIWGDGTSQRDYFFISDLISALLLAMNISYEQNLVFNIAGDKTYTLSDILEIVQEIVGVPMDVVYEPSRMVDVPNIYLDTTKAAKSMDWKPMVGIKKGIIDTCEWLKLKYF
jgi:UDP-glucose 4-epimerase